MKRFSVLKNKKALLIPKTKKAGIITIAVVVGLVVGGAGVTRSEAAMDWLGLEQKLEHIDERNDNQDDRIANTEKDVEKLQDETNTEPATERVVVREVVTENTTVQNTPEPEPVSKPKPVPIIVTKVEQLDVGGGNVDCKITFSDGTSKIRQYKRVFTGGSSTAGACDDSILGTLKSAN